MSNRHVAELFATGLRVHHRAFRPGQSSSIDFRHEVIPSDSIVLEETEVVMIHPWWDMAVLKVAVSSRLPESEFPVATLRA